MPHFLHLFFIPLNLTMLPTPVWAVTHKSQSSLVWKEDCMGLPGTGVCAGYKSWKACSTVLARFMVIAMRMKETGEVAIF